MKYCFGADVGGTTIKLGLFTVDGEILDKWEIITRTENEGESILQDIATVSYTHLTLPTTSRV